MIALIRVLLAAFLVGLLGASCALIGWQAWQDHRNLSVLLQIEMQRQSATRAPIPAPPPAGTK